MRTTSMESSVRRRFSVIASLLDERQRRLWAAAEAKAIGYGGVSVVARATGITRPTIHAGLKELAAGSILPPGRVRRAGAGGSNGVRCRLWKVALQRLADELGLAITVSHFPPGTSKWNKIEHRLFSQITTNWRGRPLTSHEVIVEVIANTRPRPACMSEPNSTRTRTRPASR